MNQRNGPAALARPARPGARSGSAWWPGRAPGDLAIVVGLALLAAAAALLEAPLVARLPLGLLAVLILPGFGLALAAFPRADDLDWPERLGLAFGLSLAVVAVLALGLNATPWGLRFTPIVLTLTAWTLLAVAAAGWRRARLAPDPALAARLEPAALLRLSRASQLGLGAFGGALLLAGAALWLTLAAPPARLTEFYLLGREGLAEDYPRRAGPGEPIVVTAGLNNREGRPASYRLVVRRGAETLAEAGPWRLAPGESWEGPVSFSLPTAGPDREVLFWLYQDDQAEPYRQLRLWLDIAAPTPTRRPLGAAGTEVAVRG